MENIDNKVGIIIVNKSNNPLPQYETEGSAGMDIRAFTNGEVITLYPGDRKMIHTGLYVKILNPDIEIQVRPRSGLAIKSGIMVINSPGTIDSDYRGECNVLLFNASEKLFEIRNGDRIAQWVINEIKKPAFITQNDVDIKGDEWLDTNRGSGGFGSTGK